MWFKDKRDSDRKINTLFCKRFTVAGFCLCIFICVCACLCMITFWWFCDCRSWFLYHYYCGFVFEFLLFCFLRSCVVVLLCYLRECVKIYLYHVNVISQLRASFCCGFLVLFLYLFFLPIFWFIMQSLCNRCVFYVFLLSNVLASFLFIIYIHY